MRLRDSIRVEPIEDEMSLDTKIFACKMRIMQMNGQLLSHDLTEAERNDIVHDRHNLQVHLKELEKRRKG